MRLAFVFFMLMFAPAVFASEAEYEIKFYYQPDSTGQNTLNKSVKIDGDKLKIEESRNDGDNRYIKRTATQAEKDALEALVLGRLRTFSFEVTERLKAPKVEIHMEFDGNTNVIEVEQEYPAGSVPAEFLDIQKLFFDDVFK